MQLFECQACGQPLYFKNVLCDSCGRQLGYLPEKTTITALELDGERYKELADPEARYFPCANLIYESCNWLIPADSEDTFCVACRHNRTIPDLSNKRNLTLWRRIEVRETQVVLQSSSFAAAIHHQNDRSDRTGLRFSGPGQAAGNDGSPRRHHYHQPGRSGRL